jgi:hypothetical protein
VKNVKIVKIVEFYRQEFDTHRWRVIVYWQYHKVRIILKIYVFVGLL